MKHYAWVGALVVSLLSVGAVPMGSASLFGVSRARADGMRCGSKLVSDGDSMLEVRNICGAPDQATQRVEMRVMRRWVDAPCYPGRSEPRCGYMEEYAVPVVLDEWLYDFGPQVLIRTVTFESGRLIRLTTGGYGNKEV
jgi:hypothetical protein